MCIRDREQMPLELVGPPGVGKTEIVEQTANELGIGFVSVSLAHHVRQLSLIHIWRTTARSTISGIPMGWSGGETLG